MKLIVGLGNPGHEYTGTRHNVGFECIDRIGDKIAQNETGRVKFLGITIEIRQDEERILLLKPTTFMNESGRSVSEAVRYYKLSVEKEVLVIVDDIDLPCGAIRIRPSGSNGGHNGLANIEHHLGTSDYTRLRIGIDPPVKIPQKDYVLGRFRPDQKESINFAINHAADAALYWSKNGATDAMNLYNTRSETSEAKEI